MSRIGKLPIPVPSGVDVNIGNGNVTVKGPKGALTRDLVSGISIKLDDGKLHVERGDDSAQQRSFHGMTRALVSNMVVGVSEGFERRLEILGVGYRAEIKGKAVQLTLGYSHSINYPFPDGVTIAFEKPNKLIVSGVDKESVGQAAADLRGMRPPDSYKGKGVRYEGEYVRLKAGKTAQ